MSTVVVNITAAEKTAIVSLLALVSLTVAVWINGEEAQGVREGKIAH